MIIRPYFVGGVALNKALSNYSADDWMLVIF